jgi:hypothetical protein
VSAGGGFARSSRESPASLTSGPRAAGKHVLVSVGRPCQDLRCENSSGGMQGDKMGRQSRGQHRAVTTERECRSRAAGQMTVGRSPVRIANREWRVRRGAASSGLAAARAPFLAARPRSLTRRIPTRPNSDGLAKGSRRPSARCAGGRHGTDTEFHVIELAVIRRVADQGYRPITTSGATCRRGRRAKASRARPTARRRPRNSALPTPGWVEPGDGIRGDPEQVDASTLLGARQRECGR